MVSICIPIYNFDLKSLVKSLHSQGKKSGIIFEILLVDDASDNYYRNINKSLNTLEHVKYLQLNENIGRAKIRNYLADNAKYDYLIVMDCDSMTPDNKYIERYVPYCKGNIIVCGGRTHYKNYGDKNLQLRWLYGTKREENPAVKRSKNPNNSFMTNNFLISKSLFKKFWLNETITGYGHEDTYFGYQLKKAGIDIIHIDNPLIHTGLETADIFIKKTKEAIVNLLKIYKLTGYDHEFVHMVSLLKAYVKIKKLRLIFILRLIYNTFNKSMIKNLKGPNPKLWVFDLFKLGYICKIAK